jgi:hypothetical protein
MIKILIGGLAAGALTVLLCTSKAGNKFTELVALWLPRKMSRWWLSLTGCTFCTSWWISLAMLDNFTIREWAATVAVANFTVLLIHWGLSTEEEEDDSQMDAEPTFREGDSSSMSRTVWVRGNAPRPV